MDTNLPTNPENASSSDVEGLLAQAAASLPPAASAASPAPPAEKSAPAPRVFRRLSSFSTTESRKLKGRHEDFIRSLTARLGGHLRVEVGLKLSRLETIPFENLLEEFANPTHIALLKLEPLKAACLLEIPPQLGLSIVDRELGGSGDCLDTDRPLTEIESRIISRIVEMIMGEWCQCWGDMMELRTVLTGHESNGAFIQSPSPDEMMLVATVEVQLGELTKPINFAFPYAALEPLIHKLNVQPETDKKPAAKTTAPAPKWNPALNDLNIKLTAEIPSLKITTKELAKLKTGDVILLEPEVFQNLRLSLAHTPKFLASAGRCGPRWAAKITKLIDPPA
jgi:flagellar motor switch protein FliM